MVTLVHFNHSNLFFFCPLLLELGRALESTRFSSRESGTLGWWFRLSITLGILKHPVDSRSILYSLRYHNYTRYTHKKRWERKTSAFSPSISSSPSTTSVYFYPQYPVHAVHYTEPPLVLYLFFFLLLLSTFHILTLTYVPWFFIRRRLWQLSHWEFVVPADTIGDSSDWTLAIIRHTCNSSLLFISSPMYALLCLQNRD